MHTPSLIRTAYGRSVQALDALAVAAIATALIATNRANNTLSALRSGEGAEDGAGIVEMVLIILIMVGAIFLILTKLILPHLNSAASSAGNCISNPGAANCTAP